MNGRTKGRNGGRITSAGMASAILAANQVGKSAYEAGSTEVKQIRIFCFKGR
jgi:hypothetical protein